MGIFDKLLGRQPADKNTQIATATNESASPTAMSDQWRQFFDIVPMHESAESAMRVFVGNWPKEIDPNVFSSLDITAFMDRVRKYKTMPYPLGPFTPDDTLKPNYKMVDGKIARASSAMDMIFISVVPADEKKKWKPNEEVTPGQVAWQLILHYSEFSLAKLIFLLPWMYSASEAAKKGDKAVIMVIEDTLIQIYKGVENLLFDVYNDLPEGGILSDQAITKKLRSLLAP